MQKTCEKLWFPMINDNQQQTFQILVFFCPKHFPNNDPKFWVSTKCVEHCYKNIDKKQCTIQYQEGFTAFPTKSDHSLSKGNQYFTVLKMITRHLLFFNILDKTSLFLHRAG